MMQLHGARAAGATAAVEPSAAREKSATVSAAAVMLQVTVEPQVAGMHGTSQRPTGVVSCAASSFDVRRSWSDIWCVTKCASAAASWPT